MARSLNRVTLIGNVGTDPDVRATASGARIAKFSLATNRTWKDSAGGTQEKTEWHRLACFGRLVDVVEQWVKKGDKLYVEGRIEYSQTEKDGVTRYWTDVLVSELIMLGGDSGPREQSPGYAPAGGVSEPDGDLPFAPMRLTDPLS